MNSNSHALSAGMPLENDDYSLISTLFRNSRYQIPERLRGKIMQSIESTLDTAADDKTKLAAIKVALEADKRNVEYLRLVVPRKVEHYNPDQKTSEELKRDIQAALERLNGFRLDSNQIIDQRVGDTKE